MRGHSLTIGKPQAASPRRESSPLPPPPAAAAVAAANPVAHLSLVVAGEGREEGVMAAAVREVGSKAELEAAVGGARAAAVHFWAAWCEASKQMDEVFAHLAVDFPHAVFLRVEAEEQPEISEAYGVAAVPYFVFLKQNGASATSSAEDALNKRLEQLVNSHPVFLFMKGTPEQPRCGFSRKVVDVLKQEGVEFGSFDILTDNDVREGMKKFSNWPTFPQLYCKGELLGGCDIVIAMHESGELKDVFKEHNIPLQPQGRKNEEAVKAEPDTEKSGAVPEPALLTAAQKARLESLVNSSPVMVFIKGTPEEPKCGFSGKLVHILKQEKIPFSSFDILTDDEVRQGLKVLSNWPSYPQLYINGELVGGSDIVMEMHKSGELKKVLSEKGIIAKESLEDRLKALISSAPVMLFMKGTPDAPRCGFSSKVVNALKQAGVSFGSFDILSDEEVRQGLKTYSNWPTFPQLYYKTELIGGCDIVLELEKSGELKSTLSDLLRGLSVAVEEAVSPSPPPPPPRQPQEDSASPSPPPPGKPQEGSVDAEEKASPSPPPSRRQKDSLFRRIAAAEDPRLPLSPVLEQWSFAEERPVAKPEIQSIIKYLCRRRRFSQALQLSMWMTERLHLHLSPGDVAYRLELITKVHGLDRAVEYFDSMPDQLKQQQCYGSLLKCYAEAKCVEKAEELFEKIGGMGMASSYAYNVMMRLYLQNGQVERVHSMYQAMEESGIAPDIFTTDTLVAAYAVAEDIEAIEKVLEKANSCNDLMTWHSYATIGKVFMQSGKQERALQAFQESEKKIAKKSNRVAYGFLLTMYADLGMNSEVDRIWDVYRSRVPASACNSMYMCRISVLLKMNDIVGAEKAYEEWESKHVYHDPRLINLLLTAYCKEGLMEKAEALVDQFIKKGRTPFANTWYKLAGGYFKVGQASKAVDLTKKALASASSEWIPDLTNVLLSLNYFTEQKNVEAAEEMASLSQRLVPPTRDVYHGLLKTYVNTGKPVSDLLDRMKKDGMEADEETEKILAGEVH
uniref:Thioredoxin domain-containing protein n=1 Tax=Oryza punctata TaxID=4537 RepID=A0A0E0M9D2_ORYPU